MTRSKLQSAFYIYSDLYIAAFLAALSIVELVCGVALLILNIQFVAYLALAGGLIFITISALMSINVFKQVKNDPFFN